MVALLWLGELPAQPTAVDLYQQLLQPYLTKAPPIQRIKGQPDFFPSVVLDSSSRVQLQVLPPEMRYRELTDGRIERTLSLSLTEQDSVLRPVSLRQTDTLNRNVFRQYFRQSPDILRGDDPTLRAKWIRPIALISLSVATFVALFYVRSR